jgi:hypothetical protein
VYDEGNTGTGLKREQQNDEYGMCNKVHPIFCVRIIDVGSSWWQ